MADYQDMIALMRLNRPWPILLTLLPVYWGLWLAGGASVPAAMVFIFTIGAILMRSAGCVINDFFDQGFDARVARTRERPLAAGRVSKKAALALAATLFLASATLLLFLNRLTCLLALIAALLSLLYPLAKRFFYWPQLLLGAAFNMGLPMAFAAVTNHLPPLIWLWYVNALLWTFIYDTQYALSDYEDDCKLKLHSTAVFFGRRVLEVLALLQGISLVYTAALLFMHAKHPYVLSLPLALIAALFYYQSILLQQRKYLRAFHSHVLIGFIVLGALMFA